MAAASGSRRSPDPARASASPCPGPLPEVRHNSPSIGTHHAANDDPGTLPELQSARAGRHRAADRHLGRSFGQGTPALGLAERGALPELPLRRCAGLAARLPRSGQGTAPDVRPHGARAEEGRSGAASGPADQPGCQPPAAGAAQGLPAPAPGDADVAGHDRAHPGRRRHHQGAARGAAGPAAPVREPAAHTRDRDGGFRPNS